MVLALLVFAAGVAALLRWVIPPAALGGLTAAERSAEQRAGRTGTPFVMTDDVAIRVLPVGTVLRVPVGDRRHDVLLARYENGLVIEYGGNEVLLAVGGERLLDLDGDSRTDLRVLLNDVDRTVEPVRVHLTPAARRGQGSGAGVDPGRGRLSWPAAHCRVPGPGAGRR